MNIRMVTMAAMLALWVTVVVVPSLHAQQRGQRGQRGAQTWEGGGARQGGGGGGSLKVVTTRMRPGYLRKNGAPYSANAGLTEYYDRYTGPNGDEWLVHRG